MAIGRGSAMYPSEVYRSYLTPLRFLQRSAYVFRNKPAIVYGERSWTYPEMAERVNRLASALRGLGLRKGDRVAALLPNIPPMLEAHFGVPLAGGILVAINTQLKGEEIAYILNHSGARVLIVDTELATGIEPVFHQLRTVETVVSVADVSGGLHLPGPEYEAFLAGGSPAPLDWPVEDEEEVIT